MNQYKIADLRKEDGIPVAENERFVSHDEFYDLVKSENVNHPRVFPEERPICK